MDHLCLWNAEDWTDREAYEAMIVELGGLDLEEAHHAARELGRRLERSLNPVQRELYLTEADANVDATALRESVATRIALMHGIGIGAVLAAYPQEAPEKLVAVSTRLMTDLLSCGLAPGVALGAMETILAALQRADWAASLPHWDGEVHEYRLPERAQPDEVPETGTEALRPEGANEEME